MVETRESLRQLIRTKLRNYKFISVSNREPFMHVYRNGHVDWIRPASGVTVALDPVMRASRGLWVAHGSGPADAEASDANGFVDVPPDEPAYRLKRVWLTKEQEAGYYYGFANSALWPLCHIAYRRPVFNLGQWNTYREVNRLFADRIAEEINGDRAFIFIQDYHFALLPTMLRARCPRAILAQFWHIPWPNPEVFRICPWKTEVLEGMLGNDILGFHIRFHCDNFMETVDRELEARPERERMGIVYHGHMTKVRALPISIDYEGIARKAASRETQKNMGVLRRKFRLRDGVRVALGVDRVDYTKGIPERLDAVGRLLDAYPEYRGRLVFIQVGVPSRGQLEEYRKLGKEVEEKVATLNWNYGAGDWQPVIYIQDHLPLETLIALYRLADILLVSSLHDGMNLVAKEYVASRVDGRGVLLLSQFAGASRELNQALILNPYSPEAMADQIREALEMGEPEMRRRMGKLREQVKEQNVYRWAAEVIRKLAKLA